MNLSPRQNAWFAGHQEWNYIGVISDYAYGMNESGQVIELSFSTTYKELVSLDTVAQNEGFKPSQYYLDWKDAQNLIDVHEVLNVMDDIHFRVQFEFIGQKFEFYFEKRNDAHSFVDDLLMWESDYDISKPVGSVDFSQTMHMIGSGTATTPHVALQRVKLAWNYYEFCQHPSSFQYNRLTESMETLQSLVYLEDK